MNTKSKTENTNLLLEPSEITLFFHNILSILPHQLMCEGESKSETAPMLTISEPH